MTPEYICIYWHGLTIPEWRSECINRLQALYPDAIKIVSLSNIKDTGAEVEYWRLLQCAKYENCLWVDNDIWLDENLDLPEGPALADEYHCGHWSICWSGNNPGAFVGQYTNTIQRLVKDGTIKKIKITGTHWASEADGSKIKRTY